MGNVDIPKWLKGMPLAPEFRPTDTEFADPIAYISKIEKEAGAYGICKIIPPLPKPSKKYVFNNLNRSLSKCPELGSNLDMSKNVDSNSNCGDSGGQDGEERAVFTTRHQELGQSGKKMKAVGNNLQCGVQKQVWQSGEIYTLEQFESKSKSFAKSLLSVLKEVSPLHIEALFWKVASEKPMHVEYANDVPGSGFGEPDGQFQYFHRKRRRRRKRMSYRRESYDSKKDEMDSVKNLDTAETKDTSVKSDSDAFFEKPKPTSSTTVSDEYSHSKRNCGNASNDMGSTAGWKLSNSPWNLQVIARSAGSLTRFMPDDIPGVTSPMVYIGMLFSWFAWHLEDHELHSMNFLHTGSSKTWYAVPGDYALAFEEVIRTEAYGGNIDRLAALSLLGEKTTILSPELIVASGIPCCRLIQNPGEFVVTFPRAYHVGFSHGFNCGEAANFGTPQWLQVAKEAAVRRAAMNYLPMLSHQQLLYLLTISFASRIPRSLLPGARSSRLRDRQKEERELLVKKAFLKDMLTENKLLSLILKRGSTYHAIIWEPDLLPYASKDSELLGGSAAVLEKEIVSDILCENNTNANNLLDELSLFMENLNYLYLNDDDLSCDLQVDSGTLACVACGVLGYPFMSVVQPSEGGTMELVPADHLLVQGPTILEPPIAHSCPNLDCAVEGSDSDNVHLLSKDSSSTSITKFPKGWDISNKYLRPRIFCLEHAVQVEKLLQSKGGAKVLVICHSDYQKIKAHAIPVAEDIGIPFTCNDVTMDGASPEDLNLINLAIDNEHDEIGEDWTSELGVNLRYCVKIRKNSPFKQVQHALPLNGIFSGKCGSSNLFNVRWKSRKYRSKGKDQPLQSKPRESIELKADEVKVEKLDVDIIKNEKKFIQYSRRKKGKTDYSIGASEGLACLKDDLPREDSAASFQHLVEHGRNKFKTNANSESRQLEILVDGVVQKVQSKILEKSDLDGDACSLAACSISPKQSEINFLERTSENNSSLADNSCCVIASVERLVEITGAVKEVCNAVSEEQYEDLSARDDILDLANSASSFSAGRCDAEFDGMAVEESFMNEGVSSQMLTAESESSALEKSCADATADGDRHFKDRIRNEKNEGEQSCFCVTPIDARHHTTPVPVKKYSRAHRECHTTVMSDGGEACSSVENRKPESGLINCRSSAMNGRRKRKREVDEVPKNASANDFVISPCEGLRPRAWKDATSNADVGKPSQEMPPSKDLRKPSSIHSQSKEMIKKGSHKCDKEGCHMSFETKEELRLHKCNRCPYEGCGKKFRSHKYAILHQRVHEDDRPLKCPWKGCSMSFKWAWARTEHIRVHTGERPYKCKVEGCNLSFRFVSDFSRHRRKTGHLS